ncbi:MAG: energy-coupling factor transporter ATPase [Anaerolineaceae bacterium]|nr:energy-coupling factor transporter ATPase [Anaerolineaceae bacterium]
MAALIEIDDLTFSYPETAKLQPPALQGVTLRVEAGEYVAIVGANGSGKTTLARQLNGLLLPTSGQVRIHGMDTQAPNNLARIRALVGMVFQSPEDQVIATVVDEDVAFGLENQGVPGVEIRPRVEAALKSVGMWEQRNRPSYLLSAGQMQRMALAGVLAMRPQVIVFDEAAALLDPLGRAAVLDLIDRLHSEGLTILTITHSMTEAARAGRVVAFSQGKVAFDGTPQRIFSNEAELHPLGLDLPPAARVANALREVLPALPVNLISLPQLLTALPPYPGPLLQGEPDREPAPESTQPALIEVSGLGHIYLAGTPLARRALENANFQATEGGGHGLLGATGSGKSTLLQHLNGLLLPQEGQVRIGPHRMTERDVDLKAVRRMVGLAFQLPEAQIFEQYVGDEIAYGPRMLGHAGTLREAVQQAMQVVGLDFEQYKDRLTSTLSGGERRKVALASILAFQPPILLLDEPTAGLDPLSRVELIARLIDLRDRGVTLVLASHHMEEVADMAGRLTVMGSGRDQISGSTGAVFTQVDALRSLGLEPPATTQASEKLRALGWPLPVGLLKPEQLAQSLRRLTRMAPT